MADDNQINWKWIERGIYLITIISGIIFYFRDEAKEEATIDTTLKAIKEKVDDFDKRWQNQSELNGRVIMYIELDSSEPDTP